MAKRKKLNKRAVVLLIILGLIAVGGGIGVFLSRLPKDPRFYAERARGAMERGQYGDAERDYLTAINASEASDPLYHYEMALLQMEIINNKPNLAEAERIDRYRKADALLRTALLRDPEYLVARKALTDFHWDLVVAGGGPGQTFIKEADALLELSPEDHETYYRRALAKARLTGAFPGQYTDPAIEDFEQAIKINSGEMEYWLGLARFHQAAGRYEEAEKTYQRSIQANPDSPELLVNYANYLHIRKRPEEAMEHIQLATTRAPKSPLGYLALASLQMGEGEFDKGLEALREAKKIDESAPGIYRGMASVYRQQKQPDKAADAVREGLTVIQSRLVGKPGEELPERVRQRLEETRLELHYLLANMLLDTVGPDQQKDQPPMPEIRESLKQMTQARTAGGRGGSGRTLPRARRTKIAGRIAIVDGEIESAIELLEQARRGFVRVELQTANILINLYFRTGSPGKAEVILNNMSRIPRFSENPSVLLAKAKLQIKYRNYTKALELVKRALLADPDNETARELDLELRLLTGMAETLPEVQDLTPKMIALLLKRASRMWVTDEREGAIRSLEDVRRMVPEDMGVISKLFSMYVAMGQLGKGAALIKEARTYNPDSELLRIQEALLNEEDRDKRIKMRLELAERIEDPLNRALEKAAIYVLIGRENEYLEQLREAEKINPNHPLVVTQLFQHAIRRQDWQLGEKMVKRATENNLDQADGKLLAAQLAMSRQEVPEGIRLLREILADHPNSKRVQVLLGGCYLLTQEYEKAEEVLGAVVDRDPGYSLALIGLARTKMALGKIDEHKELIRKAYRLAPRDPYVRERWLTLWDEDAPLEELIRKREVILREKPDDNENRVALMRLYMRANQLAKAEQQALAIWRDDRIQLLPRATLVVSYYAEVGKYSEGIRKLEELLKKTEDKVGAYVLYGRFLVKYDVRLARNAFEQAVRANPTDERGHLALARFLGEQRRWAEAASAMKKYIELRPQNLAAQKDLIRYLIEAGEFDEGTTRLEGILAANASDLEALILKGILALEQGRLDEAVQILTRAAKADPESGFALFHRGRVHRAKGDLKLARRDLEDARRLSDNVRIAAELAKVLEDTGNPSEAILVYEGILEKLPNSHMALRNLMELYLKEKRWLAMTARLKDSRKRFAKNPVYAIYEARMWMERERNDLAAQAAKAAVELRPKFEPAVRIYLYALIKDGQYKKAEEVTVAYRKDRNFPRWIIPVQALVLVKQGREAEADKLFNDALRDIPAEHLQFMIRQVVEAYGTEAAIQKVARWAPIVRPRDWLVYRLVAEMFLANGNAQEAKKLFLKALDLAKTPEQRAQVTRGLGTAYHRTGDVVKAEAAYLATLEVFPDDLYALNNLGYMLTDDMNQPAKALQYLRRAAALKPTEPNVQDSLGWALARVGKLREAEEHLRRAVQIDASLSSPRYHLGWAYEHMKRLNDAEREYQRAKELLRSKPDQRLQELIDKAIDRVRDAWDKER